MSEEAVETNEEAPKESLRELPDSVWDEYVGQHVCVQLKIGYAAVTNPGMFARGPDGGFLQIPLLRGIFGVKKDARGNVRVTMLVKDPDEAQAGAVRVDLDEEAVAVVSVCEHTEESRIISN